MEIIRWCRRRLKQRSTANSLPLICRYKKQLRYRSVMSSLPRLNRRHRKISVPSPESPRVSPEECYRRPGEPPPGELPSEADQPERPARCLCKEVVVWNGHPEGPLTSLVGLQPCPSTRLGEMGVDLGHCGETFAGIHAALFTRTCRRFNWA